MNQILKHPLLSNPLKYMTLSRCHASGNYIRNAYDTDALKIDPVATGLSETKMDGMRIRFPRGNLIRLVVKRSGQDLYLVPVIRSDKSNYRLPSHYIINNQAFVKYIHQSKQWKRYIPQKFKFYNSAAVVNKIQLASDLDKAITDSYAKEIIKSLASHQPATGDSDILLVDYGPLVAIEESRILINLHLLINVKEVALPLPLNFKDNPELSCYILQFVDYVSV